MAEGSKPQVRVILWAPPQSLSTVFQKCLSYVDDIQIVNEPYQSAAANNPEPDAADANNPKAMEQTVAEGYKNPLGTFITGVEQVQLDDNLVGVGWDNKLCTPAWVKDLLEGEFPDKKVIFAKDIVSGIRDKFHMLPKGYRHTFLIRNPIKLMLSQRKIGRKMFPLPEDQYSLLAIPSVFREWYQPMLQLIEYVKENEVETTPIIIDADDLQDHPGSIVRQYCEALGIPFKESLLEWPAGNGCVKKNWLVSNFALQGNALIGYYDAAFASTKFQSSKPLPSESEIPSDVLQVAQTEEQFYRKMYDMRLRP